MKTAIIIGAGPAGLTAAYELLTRTDIVPVVIEADKQVGGISKTVDFKGNKIDIGGHRFFSKSEKIIQWWLNFLPLQTTGEDEALTISYQNKKAAFQIEGGQSTSARNVMLIRKRKSRIFYNGELFDYPLKLTGSTLSKLGFAKTLKTGASYARAKLFPVSPETSLEDFFINRFGTELYQTFFRDYTEKVWGVPCNQIPASWGQQRVKNLNVGRLIRHALKSTFFPDKSITQQRTSTSLIEQFLYPKYGPGQLWQTVADEITRRGGKIILNSKVVGIMGDGKHTIHSLDVRNAAGEVATYQGDYFFSTMPVKELVAISHGLQTDPVVTEIASRLEYRDFLIVGLLANQLTLKDDDGSDITDNWIYVQDGGIRAGRIQFFHNWSPGMIDDPDTRWIGVEYFCDDDEPFWKLTDKELADVAIAEMESIGVLQSGDIIDHVVVRVPKAYPSYYGAYEAFQKVRTHLDRITNLFPVGRNGMHRYNNSDHSMLTAMAAVDNIVANRHDKSNIWEINTDDDYHEETT